MAPCCGRARRVLPPRPAGRPLADANIPRPDSPQVEPTARVGSCKFSAQNETTIILHNRVQDDIEGFLETRSFI